MEVVSMKKAFTKFTSSNGNDNINNSVDASEAAVHKCSYKIVFWEHVGNL